MKLDPLNLDLSGILSIWSISRQPISSWWPDLQNALFHLMKCCVVVLSCEGVPSFQMQRNLGAFQMQMVLLVIGINVWSGNFGYHFRA